MTDTQRHVIAISRAIGSGGEEIGRLVAAELELRYADEEIIVRAAEKAGVSPATVAKAESTPSLIERILESIGRTPPAAEFTAYAPVLAEVPLPFEALIEMVVKETAAQSNVVIVGHGASIPLTGTVGLLRVLVTAPEATRIERLTEAEGMDQGKARKAVQHSDEERRNYLRRFYGVDEERPDLYDLVVNTECLTYEMAARVITTVAR